MVDKSQLAKNVLTHSPSQPKNQHWHVAINFYQPAPKTHALRCFVKLEVHFDEAGIGRNTSTHYQLLKLQEHMSHSISNLNEELAVASNSILQQVSKH